MTIFQPTFATFWGSETISAYEAACINSYVAHGYTFTVYSYEAVKNLPAGVINGDARDITDPANMMRFLIRGKPNLSHFSDLFRYELSRRTDHIWVDADMLMLRRINLPRWDMLLAKEDPTSVCGAIMRLERNHPKLDHLVNETLALRDRDLVWGATGPRLLTSLFGKQVIMQESYAPQYFFPIHFREAWKILLPQYRQECEKLCASAYTLHLWNDQMVRIGIWKRFAPPRGSFLAECFAATNGLDFFEDFYPLQVMEHMVSNWRFRCEGGEIGMGQWLRRGLPSVGVTVRRRLNLPT